MLKQLYYLPIRLILLLKTWIFLIKRSCHGGTFSLGVIKDVHVKDINSSTTFSWYYFTWSLLHLIPESTTYMSLLIARSVVPCRKFCVLAKSRGLSCRTIPSTALPGNTPTLMSSSCKT